MRPEEWCSSAQCSPAAVIDVSVVDGHTVLAEGMGRFTLHMLSPEASNRTPLQVPRN